MIETLQDLRYAVRALRNAPVFTTIAVAVLALGIGATSAIFSIVHSVLLRQLPFPDPDRIVTAISVHPARGLRDGGVAYADYEDWRQHSDLFQYVALWRPQNLDLTGGDQPERVRAVAVTGEYFQVLGASPLLGSLFDAAAEAPGDTPVVLTESAWRRLFGAHQDAVGRTVHMSGVLHRIAGVLPDDAAWPSRTDAFVPLRLDPARDTSLRRRDNFIFRSMARLQPGVPIEQSRARLMTLARSIEEQFPESRKGWSYDVVGLHDYTVGADFERALLILFGAVTVVLLIACANTANLVMARGTDRRRELAVRAALGATRSRINRALLAESLVLAAAGGLTGLLVGFWVAHALVSIAPDDAVQLVTPSLSWPVVAFTATAALATLFVFGLIPALQGSLVAPNDVLKESARTGTGRAGRLRDALVTAEMALAVVLLVTSTLTIRSLLAIVQSDPGVDVSNVLGARLIAPSARYPNPDARARFYADLTEQIRALPGVRGAAITSRLPAGGPGFGLGRVFLAEGQPEPPAASDHPAQWTVVSPGYFETLAIRLVQGRTFAPADDARATPVIVISDRMARQMFPDQNPIGRRIRSWRDENQLREVVGVVEDVKYFGLADRPRAAVYVPHAQDAWGTMVLAVRTDGDPLAVVNAVRATVTAADPMLALGDIGALADFSSDSISPNRFTAQLLGGFAALALVLAAVGVYGVMAYVVSRRSHEIGIRVALGARGRDVAMLVIGRGMMLAALGVLLGSGAAAAAARGLQALIPEISAGDPVPYAAAAVLLLAAALAACAVPALRAARMDPLRVLRQA